MPKIRNMVLTDVEAVHAIELRAHRLPWSKNIIRDCVLVGYDCRVLEEEKAEQQTEILGYIISRRHLNFYHILNLCISPEHQNKKHGRFLLQGTLDSLINNSTIHTIMLEVRPSNKAAIALYQSFGFNREMIKVGYYQDPKAKEDAWLLTLPLQRPPL